MKFKDLLSNLYADQPITVWVRNRADRFLYNAMYSCAAAECHGKEWEDYTVENITSAYDAVECVHYLEIFLVVD